MASIVDYFSRMDVFAGGILGAVSLFLFFYAFSFSSVRGKTDHPWEKALELLLPPFVCGLFLNFLGLPQIVTGLAVLITYLFFAKIILDLNLHEGIVMALKVFALLMIFGFLDLWARNILFAIYLSYNLFVSEKKLYTKEHKKEEKDGKTDKKDDKK